MTRPRPQRARADDVTVLKWVRFSTGTTGKGSVSSSAENDGVPPLHELWTAGAKDMAWQPAVRRAAG